MMVWVSGLVFIWWFLSGPELVGMSNMMVNWMSGWMSYDARREDRLAVLSAEHKDSD
jgi:hypothetical protein